MKVLVRFILTKKVKKINKRLAEVYQRKGIVKILDEKPAPESEPEEIKIVKKRKKK